MDGIHGPTNADGRTAPLDMNGRPVARNGGLIAATPYSPAAANDGLPPRQFHGRDFRGIAKFLRVAATTDPGLAATWEAAPSLLGVSRAALTALRVGLYPARRVGVRFTEVEEPGAAYCSVPVFGETGNVVGIHLEPLAGPARPVTVGAPGLVHADDWDNEEQYPGLVFVSPSPGEAMALVTVGLCALGLTGPEAIPTLRARLQGWTRGVYVVGDPAWAAAVMGELAGKLPADELWCSAAPAAHRNCRGWLDARLRRMTQDDNLDDFGNELIDDLERTREKQPDNPVGVPVPEPAVPQSPLPAAGPAARALECRPRYWQSLSPAARARNTIDREETWAAEQAAWAAAAGDDAEAGRCLQDGVRISAEVDAANTRMMAAAASLEAAAPELTRPARAEAELTPRERENQEVLRLLGLEVLGEYPDCGEVEVFSARRRKTARIRNVTRLSYCDLLQVCGPVVRDHIHDTREVRAGLWQMVEVREAIATEAGAVQLDQAPLLGLGCWPADGGVVLVNGCEAGYCRDGRLQRVSVPRVGRHVLRFTGGEPLLPLPLLASYLAFAAELSWVRNTLDEAVSLLSAWTWKHRVDATVASALVACTWVQAIWPWRPLVAVPGSSDAGKTSLLKTVQKLFGPFASYTLKATEAGVRQHVTTTASVLLLDEFENDAGRQKVLELFRTSSQGGAVIRGSSDQRVRRFHLQHIPWTAAIESGLTKAADRNRFIMLELDALPAERRGKLVLPRDEDLRDLGLRLLAVALAKYERAIGLFGHLKGQRLEGVHGRIVENYALPAAFWAAALGHDETGAEAVLTRFLAGRRTDTGEIVADERQLVNAILESEVDVSPGVRRTVAEIVSDQRIYDTGWDAMERKGVGLVPTAAPASGAKAKTGPKPRLLPALPFAFFAADAMRRTILKGTRWCEMDIDQMLLRVPGAGRCKKRLAGKVTNGVCVPIKSLGELGTDPAEPLPELPPD